MLMSKVGWFPPRTPRISYVLNSVALNDLPSFRDQVLLAAGVVPLYEGQTWTGQRYAITIYSGYLWYTAGLYVEVDERLNNGKSTIKCLSYNGYWTNDEAQRMAREWRRCLATSPPIFGLYDEKYVRECSRHHNDNIFGIPAYSNRLCWQVEATSSLIYFPVDCLRTPGNYLRPGDHVVAWRGMIRPFTYHHDGIYAGNGRVIHMTVEQKLGSHEGVGRVTNVDWNTFIGPESCTIGVFIYEIRMRKAEDILTLAYLCANCDHTYDLFMNNCQHFATLCASGVRFSREADGYSPIFQHLGNKGFKSISG